MEYHENFGPNIGRIQQIAIMSRIDICYTACYLQTQTVTPNVSGFQGIKLCIQYMASHPHKPIFYDGSNFIRLTWILIQVKDYTTQNSLEFHQDEDHARIIFFLLLDRPP